MRKLDIVIPTALIAGHRRMVETLASVLAFTASEYRLILVVNSPRTGDDRDEAIELWLADSGYSRPDVTILDMGGPAGFSRACNFGLVYSDAPFVCLLSDDVTLVKDWDVKLINHLVGGAEMSLPACREPGRANSSHQFCRERNEVNLACFICVMFPRSTIEDRGLLHMHPKLAQLGSDDEYCARVRRAGGKIVIAGDCCVTAGRRTTIGQLTPLNESEVALEYLRSL